MFSVAASSRCDRSQTLPIGQTVLRFAEVRNNLPVFLFHDGGLVQCHRFLLSLQVKTSLSRAHFRLVNRVQVADLRICPNMNCAVVAAMFFVKVGHCLGNLMPSPRFIKLETLGQGDRGANRTRSIVVDSLRLVLARRLLLQLLVPSIDITLRMLHAY